MKDSLKWMFRVMVCLLLASHGVGYAQTEQTQEQVETQPAEQEQESSQAATQQQTPAQAGEARDLPVALEAEMTVAEHWSKNPYPKTIAAGSRVHVVVRGDTLWDLAQRYYNNPFLWPQIWDANNYIPNAHWIYPGDPIVIPPLSPVTEEKIAKEMEQQEEAPPTEAPGPTIVAPEKRGSPIALDLDLYCSGYLTQSLENLPVKVIGNEENLEKVSLSLGDIVYLNRGEAEGISPGDEFTIIHHLRSIEHPVKLNTVGQYVVQTGRLKVVATQEHTSTAQITYSCDAARVDDYLVPFEPREVPLFTEMPPVDRFSQDGPNAKGYVVFTKDDMGTVGTGHEVYIDLGSKDGLQVGSRLVLYRPHEETYEKTGFERDIPRRVLGEMVVFNVQDNTATGRIIQMYSWVQVGDRVEVR